MFKSLLKARYVHLMVLSSRGDTTDKYGERTDKDKIIRVPCVADGSESSVRGENGERFNVSYSVQLDTKPVMSPGDRVNELKTAQGDILFTNGIVRRVVRLIDPHLGIVAQTLSIQVKN